MQKKLNGAHIPLSGAFSRQTAGACGGFPKPAIFLFLDKKDWSLVICISGLENVKFIGTRCGPESKGLVRMA